jgi:hypothetical protein
MSENSEHYPSGDPQVVDPQEDERVRACLARLSAITEVSTESPPSAPALVVASEIVGALHLNPTTLRSVYKDVERQTHVPAVVEPATWAGRLRAASSALGGVLCRLVSGGESPTFLRVGDGDLAQITLSRRTRMGHGNERVKAQIQKVHFIGSVASAGDGIALEDYPFYRVIADFASQNRPSTAQGAPHPDTYKHRLFLEYFPPIADAHSHSVMRDPQWATARAYNCSPLTAPLRVGADFAQYESWLPALGEAETPAQAVLAIAGLFRTRQTAALPKR